MGGRERRGAAVRPDGELQAEEWPQFAKSNWREATDPLDPFVLDLFRRADMSAVHPLTRVNVLMFIIENFHLSNHVQAACQAYALKMVLSLWKNAWLRTTGSESLHALQAPERSASSRRRYAAHMVMQLAFAEHRDHRSWKNQVNEEQQKVSKEHLNCALAYNPLGQLRSYCIHCGAPRGYCVHTANLAASLAANLAAPPGPSASLLTLLRDCVNSMPSIPEQEHSPSRSLQPASRKRTRNGPLHSLGGRSLHVDFFTIGDEILGDSHVVTLEMQASDSLAAAFRELSLFLRPKLKLSASAVKERYVVMLDGMVVSERLMDEATCGGSAVDEAVCLFLMREQPSAAAQPVEPASTSPSKFLSALGTAARCYVGKAVSKAVSTAVSSAARLVGEPHRLAGLCPEALSQEDKKLLAASHTREAKQAIMHNGRTVLYPDVLADDELLGRDLRHLRDVPCYLCSVGKHQHSDATCGFKLKDYWLHQDPVHMWNLLLNEAHGDCFFAGSNWYTCAISHGGGEEHTNRVARRLVMKCTRLLSRLRLIAMPRYNGCHWTFIVVHAVTSGAEQKQLVFEVEHVDSYHQKHTFLDSEKKAIQYLLNFWLSWGMGKRARTNSLGSEPSEGRAQRARTNSSGSEPREGTAQGEHAEEGSVLIRWMELPDTRTQSMAPSQELNPTDCAIHVMLHELCLARGISPPPFRQADMPYLRQVVTVALIKQTLPPKGLPEAEPRSA